MPAESLKKRQAPNVAPCRCTGKNCNSIDFEQVGEIKRVFGGNPVDVVVVGGSFACLRCRTVVAVTPEGVFESAFQPSAFINAIRDRAPGARVDDSEYDMGMDMSPPQPGRRAR